MEDLIIYTIKASDIVEIFNKKIGKMGELIYHDRFKQWVFSPIENFYYKPVHLALIVKRLNQLNNYGTDNKKEE